MEHTADAKDETLLEDFPLAYGLPQEAPLEEEEHSNNQHSEDISEEEEISSQTTADPKDDAQEDVHNEPSFKSALRTAMQWCDLVANEPNDIVGNLKKQMPLFIAFGILVIFLWILYFIYR